MIKATTQAVEMAARIWNLLASRVGQEEEPKFRTRASASKRAIKRNDRKLAADRRTQRFVRKLRRPKRAARKLRVNSKRMIERKRRLELLKNQSLKVPKEGLVRRRRIVVKKRIESRLSIGRTTINRS